MITLKEKDDKLGSIKILKFSSLKDISKKTNRQITDRKEIVTKHPHDKRTYVQNILGAPNNSIIRTIFFNGQKIEKPCHRRRYSNGQQAHANALNIFSQQVNVN